MEREKLTHIYNRKTGSVQEFVGLKEEEEKMIEQRKTESKSFLFCLKKKKLITFFIGPQ